MTHPITADDLWGLARVGQPAPGPDGAFAVVPVTTYDSTTDEGTTRLYRVDLDGTTTALTGPTASSTAPAVSPDGSLVAFLRKEGESDTPQIHVMRLDGGESECLTDLPCGAIGMRWLPDTSGLIALVPLLRGHGSVEATATERARRAEREHRPVVTEDRTYRFWKTWLADGDVHHVFRIGLGGDLVDLTPELETVVGFEPTIEDVAVAPDGDEVAFSAIVDLAADQHQTAVFTVRTVGGPATRVTDEATAHERRPRYSPDGGSLLFGVRPEWDYYADPDRLIVRDRATGATRHVAAGWDRSPTGWEYIDDATLVIGAEDAGRTRVFTVPVDGGDPTPLETPHSTHGVRPVGMRLWARTESLTSPPEVIELTTGTRTRFNAEAMDALELGAVEYLDLEGADGGAVQAYVAYPPGFDPAARQWPLVHNIHGGPHGVTGDTWHWRWNSQVFAAGGYVIVAVNFHGSVGWGDAFTRSIRGAWGDKPGADVLAATDHMVERGFIDASRMAVAGGSYGGYLVTWLTAITDRFAAAICHAGVTDLLGQWASDITAGREKAIGGVPWESMDDVMEWSPLAHTHTITTPTLVIHGERDYRVVVTQGLSLYGILKHKGVPARLVYYPDEGHWIEKRSNSIHWHHEFMTWLARWLG